jgi:hypothetical protein
MTPSPATDPGNIQKLPRRDWLLLPLIGILTLVLVAVTTEALCRYFFPASQSGMKSLFDKNDPSGDERVLPNTSYTERIAEGKYLAEYKFNSCGHRAAMECGPKPAGTYRIVLIGSSVAQGLYIPRELTFAALLPGELSQITGRKVDLYNEATGGKYRGGPTPARDDTRQFNEVMAENPDLILWVVTPLDIANPAFEDPVATPAVVAAANAAPTAKPNAIVNAYNKVANAIAQGKLEEEFRYRWDQTRSSLVLKHLLLGADSQDAYVHSYLRNEEDSGFLRNEPGPKWQRLRKHFEAEAALYESRAKAAGVPFAAVLVPNRAQAAMVAKGQWPAGYDPYKLDAGLRSIIEGNGGIFLDILPDYKTILNPEQRYFPVDGHPDADGHAMISKLLAKELTSGAVPGLKAATEPQTAQSKSGEAK